MQQNIIPGFKIRKLLILIFLAASLMACTENVDLYTDSHPVPIVYCLLDPAAEVQFVRIGRSYQASSDVINHSPVMDSTVWNIPHEVYMEEYTGDVKGTTYRFEPENDIKKDSGFFPVSNLRLYVSAFKPVPGKSYHLYVYFPDIEKMASAKTIVHGVPEIMDPLPLSIRKINFEAGQPYIVRWMPGLYSGVYQMIFRINYRDSTAAGLEFNSADYTGDPVFDLKTDQMLERSMGGPSFFTAMANEIPVIQGVVREIVSVEFIMTSGGADLGFLYRTSVETGSNFTNLAEYSNVRNGFGVFSSRTVTRIPNLALSAVTIDQLAHDDKTASLGFKDSKGN